MRRKPIRFYATILAAAVASSACMPTAQIMAKNKPGKEVSEAETEKEEEEAVEEYVQEEEIQEVWAAAEEYIDPPVDGGTEEEAAPGTGVFEETQAEPDVSPEQTEAGGDESVFTDTAAENLPEEPDVPADDPDPEEPDVPADDPDPEEPDVPADGPAQDESGIFSDGSDTDSAEEGPEEEGAAQDGDGTGETEAPSDSSIEDTEETDPEKESESRKAESESDEDNVLSEPDTSVEEDAAQDDTGEADDSNLNGSQPDSVDSAIAEERTSDKADRADNGSDSSKDTKKKNDSEKKGSESSPSAGENTFDIIGRNENTDDTAETEENAAPVWDYSGTVSGGSYWDSSWFVQSDFRFTQVDKVPVISEGDMEGISVYSSTGGSQKVIGILPYFSIAYVLEDDVDGDWIYIESGNVRGFIPADEVAADDYAQNLIDEIGEDHFTTGFMTCEKADNEAFTYTKTTVYDVLADKNYAVSLVKGDIYEYPSMDSRAVGESGSGTLAYVLEETDDGWVFVESGDVRGFIQSSSILSGDLAEDIVNDVGEDEIVKATQLIDPEDNRSLYYTLKSVMTTADSMGESVAEYALSLVGQTKYVWGGTSLISGADCSGFTQSVFASFGINIPRLAEDQGASGEAVASLADAKPGDIIYYASGPHVGIYIGNGKVVQCSGGSANTASNPGRGATVSNADYMPVTSIRRYIIPTSEREITSDSGDPTNYTQDQLELIWAIVAQEDNGSYEGALAVISSAMNRADSAQWASCGSNALEQLTAPGQYCYSNDLNWIPRLNGNVPDYVKQAVSDCLDRGIRNHSYTSFRSYYTNGSVQIAGGNYYFG